jgi:hypothetical protein
VAAEGHVVAALSSGAAALPLAFAMHHVAACLEPHGDPSRPHAFSAR